MKTETFVTEDNAIDKVVRSVIESTEYSEHSKATYLRSLAAGLQTELGNKPLMAKIRGPGRRKAPEVSATMEAFERTNKRFYDVVLAVVNELGTDALTRNARSGFARSAASTLRRALRLGLNPLTIVIPDLTKTGLREWCDKHAPPAAPVTAAQGIQRVRAMVQDLATLVESMEKKDRAAVIAQFYQELEAVEGPLNEPAPLQARKAQASTHRGH